MKTDENSRKLLERIVSKINLSFGYSLINIKDCSYQLIPINFYSDFKLYNLFDCSYTPVVHYSVLDNEKDTIILENSTNNWYRANEIETPKLSMLNIIDYLKTVFSTSSTNGQKFNVIASIDDIDFNQMPSNDQFVKIESAIKPPVISFNNKVFTILVCLLEGKNLYDSLIQVNSSGEIEISDNNLILENIPVDELVWE
jgi:hypothetical protein